MYNIVYTYMYVCICMYICTFVCTHTFDYRSTYIHMYSMLQYNTCVGDLEHNNYFILFSMYIQHVYTCTITLGLCVVYCNIYKLPHTRLQYSNPYIVFTTHTSLYAPDNSSRMSNVCGIWYLMLQFSCYLGCQCRV